MKRMFFYPLTLVAATGFGLSAMCHLLSWFHLAPPGGEAAFALHVGIFVVWIPLALQSNRAAAPADPNSFDRVLAQLPGWARSGVSALFAYSLVNFVAFLVLTHGYPKHGIPVWLLLRGFSGHWMVFYYIGAATLYSASRLGPQGERHCPLGHDVSPFAKYCETCGAAVGPPPIA